MQSDNIIDDLDDDIFVDLDADVFSSFGYDLDLIEAGWRHA